MTVDVYASSIAGPHYFWCQHANTEDLDKVSSLAKEAAQGQDVIPPENLKPEPTFFWCQFANTEDLCKVSQLAQEAGEAQQDVTFPQRIGPGSHCLALFPDDKLWYRALIVQKGDKTLHVLFVDYGNESDIDIQDIRPLPQNLLEQAPQAFLCRLFGFDESKGSWDDQAYDFFYNLLIEKPLKLQVFSVESHSEVPVPQYSVEIKCKGVSINASLLQHWKLKENVL
ncbi:hypothetical protein AMECASPLE_028872 [Ameca splendens]|uniref:Tudor domain-containing protein n=1 Tax=Ameca splendens TaxID=208324 RepID=A0ABV0Z3G7_9TELE